MGTFIAHRVKQLIETQLSRQVELGLISQDVSNQALTTRFKFIGIDSHRESYADQLSFYPIGDQGSVNDIVRRFRQKGGFNEWWPAKYEPGNFVAGCGHVRLKGKLAYFIARENGMDIGNVIRTAVGNALALIDQVRVAPGATNSVSVFVCASLSGGTGGGNFLTILQSIKSLGARVKVYGVVIDASIASLRQPVDNLKDVEVANHWSGLVELDAWMNHDSTLCDNVGWKTFLPTDRQVTTIAGERPAADFIWLFDMTNAAGQELPSQTQAISQAADTIATWIHSSSSAAAGGMDSDITQWITDAGAMTDLELGRPTSYGAMGVSHLEFPARRIIDYLAASLAIETVQRYLMASPAEGRKAVNEAVDRFLDEASIREANRDEILSRLRDRRASLPAIPPMEAALKQAANKNMFDGIANTAVTSLDANSGRLTAYKNACAVEIGTLLSGPVGGDYDGAVGLLGRAVRDVLTSSANGLVQAREFLVTLRSRVVDTEAASVRREVEGDGSASGGLEKDVLQLKSRLQYEVKGLPSIFPPRQNGNIEAFSNGWWRQYVSRSEGIIERRAALTLYAALVDEIDLRVEALDATRRALDAAVEQLRTVESTALARPAAADPTRGGITVEVLTDPELIRTSFSWAPADAEAVAREFLGSDVEGVLGRYNEFVARQQDVRAQKSGAAQVLEARRIETEGVFRTTLFARASAAFADTVNSLGIWDAIEREVQAARPAAETAEKVAYIRDRLGPVVEAAQPMFPVDFGALVGTTAAPQISILVVANNDSTDRFGDRIGATRDWLQNAVQAHLGQFAFAHIETPDVHRVTLIRRLIGFPLMAADRSVASKALTAMARLENRWQFWTDVRAARLPRDFEPIKKSEIEYVAALALGFGIIAYSTRKDGTVDRAHIRHRDSKRNFADGVVNLLTKLELDSEDYRMLHRNVTDTFGDRPRKSWLEAVADIENTIFRELDGEQPGTDRYGALRRMYDAVHERLERVEPKYNAKDPTTDSELDYLRPRVRD